MTKIDIVSGFLGAGKTTLIKKLIAEAFQGQKLVLIENEFGEIGIDGGFLKDAGIEITEMNSGCICCSLVGDFGTALKEVLTKFEPDRILIEPSGVGKLSDVIRAVQNVQAEEPRLALNSFVTVVDATKAKMYMKNFGEFFNNQVESANAIVLSRTQKMTQDKLEACVALLREHNPKAAIITTPWDELTGAQINEAMEKGHALADEMAEELYALASDEDDEDECCCCEEEEHAHHEDEAEECSCECRDYDPETEAYTHGHHEDDHEAEHEHEHHHDHDHEHEHHHHHHHDGHDADEVFTSWGQETPHRYTKQELEAVLKELSGTDTYGNVLRAKGMLPTPEGEWMYFDLTPGEYEIRSGEPEYTGRLCVIGADLKEDDLSRAFHLN